MQNPTRTDSTRQRVVLTATLSGPQVDGGQIAPRSGGSGKGDIFYNARWQFNANAFYQLPAGFDVGANLFGRQGYVQPFIIQASAGGDGTVRALATSDARRNAAIPTCGTSIFVSRSRSASARTKFLISADLFNVLNTGTTLSRNRNLASGAFGTINEILSPRILRIGVKFQF